MNRGVGGGRAGYRVPAYLHEGAARFTFISRAVALIGTAPDEMGVPMFDTAATNIDPVGARASTLA